MDFTLAASPNEEPVLALRYSVSHKAYRWRIIGNRSRNLLEGKTNYPDTPEGNQQAERRLKNLHLRWQEKNPEKDEFA